MKEKKYSDHLVLVWSRGIKGEKNQSINSKLDTCDRLGTLLYKSILMAFYSPVFFDICRKEKNDLYNKSPEFFIKMIYDNLLIEMENLQKSSNYNNNVCLNIVSNKETILGDKARILDLVSVMLRVDKERRTFSEDMLNVIDYFDFGYGHSFLKEYAKYFTTCYINNTRYNELKSYISLPFQIPVVNRSGFSLEFWFSYGYTGVLTYSNDAMWCSPYTFIFNTTIPKINSDGYLAILASYGCIPSTYGTIGLLYGLNKSFNTQINKYNTKYTISYYTDSLGLCINSCFDYSRKLLNLIKNKYTTSQCEIGRLTNILLSKINKDSLPQDEKTILNMFVNKDISSESIIDKTSEHYCKILDPKSIFFKKPNNLWLTKNVEESEDVPDIEIPDDPKEDPETTPEEEPSKDEPKEEPKDTPVGEPKEDPKEKPEETPEEKPEDTPKDKPIKEDDDVPEDDKIKVIVPKGSYLIKIINPDTASLDDYFYRRELLNVINKILTNPPSNANENNLLVLQEIVDKWIFVYDNDFLKSIVKDFLNVIQKVE
jgi:hypothetical protein